MKKCPFAQTNEHYPYEGMVTKHRCLIKPTLELVCDAETEDGCVLLNKMEEDQELREFLQGWRKDYDCYETNKQKIPA